MRGVQAVILAAGMGTRLGRPLPKPLTPLRDGRSILRQQIDNLRGALHPRLPITAVVGFRADLVMAAAPDVLFAHNPHYHRTNTARSLLTALRASGPGGVLWLNGDVVFDARLLRLALPLVQAEQSFVCVNTTAVGDEEVKYTLDPRGRVRELSKTVRGGLGEAVGINFVSGPDRALLEGHLEACRDDDYFERGIETAILRDGMCVRPVDISRYAAVEVDVEDDLVRALRIHAPATAAG